MLTKRQKETLDFIKSYKNRRLYAPSLEEIKKHLRLSSVSTAYHHVRRLQEGGYLQKEHNQPRSVSFAKEVQNLIVPILGTIAAGQPIEVIENKDEMIVVTKDAIGKSGKHYALRVQGNSMLDEGIFDGDTVIIREQKVAENGQTVVAIVDDNQATLKKLYKENGKFRLQPANPSLFPIYKKNIEIRGVVVKIIRDLEKPTEKESASNTKYQRRIDYSWDFKGERTKSYTHGLHTYPAMFIPQVAKRLLQTYSKKGDTICDIFSGSGTALIESRLLGRNSYGIDLNPLAIFLAKSKTTPIEPSKLSREYFSLFEKLKNIKDNQVKRPKFFNLDFWFKDPVIIKLAKLKKTILVIENSNVKNFFLTAFSETVRLCSNSKSGEFKLVRRVPNELEKFNPDVFGIFKKKIEFNIKGMSDFYKDVDRTTWTKIIHGNSSEPNQIKDNSIDCIVTSPPYGDSRTTVAYGQFSRLSSQWIDVFEDPDSATKVDNDLLGGKITKDLFHSLKSQHLKEALEKISKVNEQRAREVLSFNVDLEKCLKQAYKILKPNKYFCLVIGNRLVKQVRIPTDFIIAELAENIGFSCHDIFVRNIPGKRMPIKNSPTNVVGVLEETMNKESVVILRKN